MLVQTVFVKRTEVPTLWPTKSFWIRCMFSQCCYLTRTLPVGDVNVLRTTYFWCRTGVCGSCLISPWIYMGPGSARIVLMAQLSHYHMRHSCGFLCQWDGCIPVKLQPEWSPDCKSLFLFPFPHSPYSLVKTRGTGWRVFGLQSWSTDINRCFFLACFLLWRLNICSAFDCCGVMLSNKIRAPFLWSHITALVWACVSRCWIIC